MSWRDYSSAPAAGSRVCALEAVDPVVSVTVTTGRGAFPMIVVMARQGLRGYVNACPHQFLPLDHAASRILSADGTALLCSVHGARFRADDGSALDGVDCGLDPVPVIVAGGMVLIAQD